MIKVDEFKKQAAGSVVLTEDSLDANKKPVHAGTQIAPNVDGWPEHRVLNHLVQKKAKVGSGTKTTKPDEPDENDEHERKQTHRR